MNRIRLFLWRHQRLLAAAYLSTVAFAVFAVWFYWARVPASVDTGLTVAIRSLYHSETFAHVRLAQRDFDRGAAATDTDVRDELWNSARRRLEFYLDSQSSVQPDRLHTQAIVAATELLARIHRERGQPRRAAKLCSRLAEKIPLNYHLHWLAGQALEEAGDLPAAARALRTGFKLAINNADLANDYLSVLSEQNAFDDILWVAKHFDNGIACGRPSAELKVGVGRGGLQRQVLKWSGVPVEHGNYTRSVTIFGLNRGPSCWLRAPVDLFDDWSQPGALFVQCRFEGVYDGVRGLSMRYWTRDGSEHSLALSEDTLATHHRPMSGVESYLEIRSTIDATTVQRIEIEYSCAQQALSKGSRAAIARATANVGGER